MAWQAFLGGIAKGLGVAGGIKSMSQSQGGAGKVGALIGTARSTRALGGQKEQEKPALAIPQAPSYNIGETLERYKTQEYLDY